MSVDSPALYRLTRPDGLGFFKRRSATQFALGFLAIVLLLLATVLSAIGIPGRIGLGITGVVVFAVAGSRTPSGEDLIDLLRPVLKFLRRRLTAKDRWAAALVTLGGDNLPPIFAGIALFDLDPKTDSDRRGTPYKCGVVLDRADGSVSVVLRVHGDGFLLFDPGERDRMVGAFGAALASLNRDESSVTRAAWSQFVSPALFGEHLLYMETTERAGPDQEMKSAYAELVEEARPQASHIEVLVTLTAAISSKSKRGGRFGPRSRSEVAAKRLTEEARLFATELENAGLVVAGPLPASSIARTIRERLDPTTRERLARRRRSLADAIGLVTPQNGFPLLVEERARAVRTDDCWHRVLRVAEWPRSAVPADWLATFLAERGVSRSFTVVFEPQARRDARRQALSAATRVGASIDERESKGRRVGAEERRAQFAAESLDEELEAGAEMELVIGLVDVCARSEHELIAAVERTSQSGADVGLELRTVELRQAEALVASLPIGRIVLGRAR